MPGLQCLNMFSSPGISNTEILCAKWFQTTVVICEQIVNFMLKLFIKYICSQKCDLNGCLVLNELFWFYTVVFHLLAILLETPYSPYKDHSVGNIPVSWLSHTSYRFAYYIPTTTQWYSSMFRCSEWEGHFREHVWDVSCFVTRRIITLELAIIKWIL